MMIFMTVAQDKKMSGIDKNEKEGKPVRPRGKGEGNAGRG